MFYDCSLTLRDDFFFTLGDDGYVQVLNFIVGFLGSLSLASTIAKVTQTYSTGQHAYPRPPRKLNLLFSRIWVSGEVHAGILNKATLIYCQCDSESYVSGFQDVFFLQKVVCIENCIWEGSEQPDVVIAINLGLGNHYNGRVHNKRNAAHFKLCSTCSPQMRQFP